MLSEIHGKSIIHFTVGMHVAEPNDANAGGKDALQFNKDMPFLVFLVYLKIL